MNSLIIFLALIFGGIAIWAGINLMRVNRKPAQRTRPRVIAPSPTDPLGAARVHGDERDSLPTGHR